MEQQLSISELTFTKNIEQFERQVLHIDSIAFLSKLVEEFLPRREKIIKR